MGLLDAPDDPVGAHRVCRVGVRLLVEPHFLGDELGGEQPIDLAPGVGDVGCDGVAEHLRDRGEEVVAHDGVLLRTNPEGDVLVGDPLHHVVVVATVEMDYATSDDVSAGCGLPVGEVVGDAVDVVSGGAHGGQQSWQLHDKVQRTWPPRTVDVGARGHGFFKDLVLGSVSSHCVHHATCTVVVVRPNDGNNENGELT